MLLCLQSHGDSTESTCSAGTSEFSVSNAKEVCSARNEEENNEWHDIEAEDEEDAETIMGSSHADDGSSNDMNLDIADLNDVHASQIISEDEDDDDEDVVVVNDEDNDDGVWGDSDESSNDDDNDDDGDGGGGGGGAGENNDGIDEDDDEDISAFSIEQGPLMRFRPDVRENHFLWIMMAEASRYNLSIEATLGIIRAIKKLCNHNTLPSTKKTLWKRVGRKEETTQERHMYCKMCKGKVGIGKVLQEDCRCGISGPNKEMSLVSFFIKLDVKKQLQQIFQTRNITQLLNYRITRQKINPEGIEDVFDGGCYKQLRKEGRFLNDNGNFSLTLNTDGCQVGKSSKQTAWPVLLMLNELPHHARKRFIIIAGIWVDEEQPSFEVYMEPIISDLQDLYNTGIRWSPDGNGQMTSKFVTTICTLDSPARAKLLNTTSYNGKYGCNFCYAIGTRMENGSRKYAMEEIVDRTDQEIRRHMEKVNHTKKRQKGLIGQSTLRYLPQYDLRLGVVVDSMHCVDIGVVKKLTHMIVFEPPPDIGHTSARMQRIIDERLLMIRTPSSISRKPKSIKLFKLWKASEWRNWLLYCCTVCLDGLIPEKYMTLFTTLSDAMHTLNGDLFTSEELEIATGLINDFVAKYEEAFGTEHMTTNMHLLRHLPRSVKCWGPVWAHNCYAFESFNSRILKSLNSSTGRQVQIVNRYLMTDFVSNVRSDPTANVSTKRIVKEMTNSARKVQNRNDDDYEDFYNFRGYGKSTTRDLLEWERNILAEERLRCCQRITVCGKAIFKGTMYTSRDTDNELTRSCDTFLFTKKGEFAEIIRIVSFITNEGYEINGFFVSWFENSDDAPPSRHMHSLRISRSGFVKVQDVRLPAIIITKNAVIYGIKMANTWETD